jgi:hypothetical protein
MRESFDPDSKVKNVRVSQYSKQFFPIDVIDEGREID